LGRGDSGPSGASGGRTGTGSRDDTLFGGDLVLSSTPGYWAAGSQGGQIRIEHFTDGASDTTTMNADTATVTSPYSHRNTELAFQSTKYPDVNA
jgi:hypothetical protein